jgi:hypothetical protein
MINHLRPATRGLVEGENGVLLTGQTGSLKRSGEVSALFDVGVLAVYEENYVVIVGQNWYGIRRELPYRRGRRSA